MKTLLRSGLLLGLLNFGIIFVMNANAKSNLERKCSISCSDGSSCSASGEFASCKCSYNKDSGEREAYCTSEGGRAAEASEPNNQLNNKEL